MTTWNAAFEASPADIDDIADGAGKIRELKSAISDRLGVDHYFDLSGTDADHGEHTMVTLRKRSAKPTAEADKGYVYTKIVGDHVELFFENESGTEIQLTVLGALPTNFPAGLKSNSVDVLTAAGTAYQDVGMNSGATATEWYDGPRALLTAVGDILYASAANTLKALNIGSAGDGLRVNPNADDLVWGAGVYVEAVTRNLGATSATVTYTGPGWEPSAIILFLQLASSHGSFSMGVSTASLSFCIYNDLNPYVYLYNSTSILGRVGTGGTAFNEVTLDEFNSNGCKLLWAKTGSPTGTARGALIYLR